MLVPGIEVDLARVLASLDKTPPVYTARWRPRLSISVPCSPTMTKVWIEASWATLSSGLGTTHNHAPRAHRFYLPNRLATGEFNRGLDIQTTLYIQNRACRTCADIEQSSTNGTILQTKQAEIPSSIGGYHRNPSYRWQVLAESRIGPLAQGPEFWLVSFYVLMVFALNLVHRSYQHSLDTSCIDSVQI